MIGIDIMKASLREVSAGAVIVATVLVVAGCQLPEAEQTAPPATPTPASSPAVAGGSPVPAGVSSRLRVVPTATTEVTNHHSHRSTPCTTVLDLMRQYAGHHVAKWTDDGSRDGSRILLTHNAAVWAVTPDGSRLWRLAEAWGQTRPGPRFSFGWMTSFDVTRDGKQIVYATCQYPPDRPGARLAPLERYDFDYELAVVGLDGQAPRRLTRHEAFDNYPAWSPDGTRIAFVSNRDAPDSRKHRQAGLYTMAADGAGVQRLAPGLAGVAWQPPAWSPDGGSIAVAVGNGDLGKEGHALYVVPADGAEFVRLSEVVSGGAWSPDGTRLAFAKPEGTQVALYTIAADGSDPQRVTTVPYWQAWIHTIAWSPDGAQLLYSCGHICVVKLDGEPVGETPSLEGRAVWSPDGARIAVAASPELPHYEEPIVLYSAAPDGSDRRTLAWRDVGLVAAQAAHQDLATSRAACAAGFVVPAPKANPGLVRDCETLLAARAALFGQRLVNWGAGSPIERWEGVTVAGLPPRVTGLGLCRWCLGRMVDGPFRIGCIPSGLKHLRAYDTGGLGWPVCEAGS